MDMEYSFRSKNVFFQLWGVLLVNGVLTPPDRGVKLQFPMNKADLSGI